MKYHPSTIDSLIRANPSIRNTIIILSSILEGYSSKYLIDNKKDFNISLTDDSLSTTVSRLRKFIK